MEGRKKKLNPETAEKLKERVATGVSKARVAREFGIARPTLYQYLAESTTSGALPSATTTPRTAGAPGEPKASPRQIPAGG